MHLHISQFTAYRRKLIMLNKKPNFFFLCYWPWSVSTSVVAAAPITRIRHCLLTCSERVLDTRVTSDFGEDSDPVTRIVPKKWWLPMVLDFFKVYIALNSALSTKITSPEIKIKHHGMKCRYSKRIYLIGVALVFSSGCWIAFAFDLDGEGCFPISRVHTSCFPSFPFFLHLKQYNHVTWPLEIVVDCFECVARNHLFRLEVILRK